MENLRPAWRSQLGLLSLIVLTAAITLVGGAVAGDWTGLVAVAGLIVVLVLTMLLLYRHYAHRYYVDEGRIEHQVGIIGRQIRSVRLMDLRNVNLRQSIVERLLGIGTLEFSSAGGSGIEVRWKGIDDPAETKRRIETLRGR